MCKRVIAQECLDDLPSQESMIKLGYGNLAYIIKDRFGGFREFRSRFEQYRNIKSNEPQQLEDVLEIYISDRKGDEK